METDENTGSSVPQTPQTGHPESRWHPSADRSVSRIQMEANFGAVAVVNTTVQLRLPVAAGTADKDHAGFLEIVVDLSSQCCPHRSLHIEIFLQRIQIRDVAFQRRHRRCGTLRQRLDQVLKVHVCRSFILTA